MRRPAFERLGVWMIALVLVWFLAALLVGHWGLFRHLPFWVPPLVPLSLSILIILAAEMPGKLNDQFRHIPDDWLVGTGLLRVLTVVFITPIGASLPSSFRWPVAGAGFVVGVGAALLLSVPAIHWHRFAQLRRWWHWLGLIQALGTIVLVGVHIGLGFGSRFRDFPDLPLNLFPSFVVPLSIAAHILALRRPRPFP